MLWRAVGSSTAVAIKTAIVSEGAIESRKERYPSTLRTSQVRVRAPGASRRGVGR